MNTHVVFSWCSWCFSCRLTLLFEVHVFNFFSVLLLSFSTCNSIHCVICSVNILCNLFVIRSSFHLAWYVSLALLVGLLSLQISSLYFSSLSVCCLSYLPVYFDSFYFVILWVRTIFDWFTRQILTWWYWLFHWPFGRSLDFKTNVIECGIISAQMICHVHFLSMMMLAAWWCLLPAFSCQYPCCFLVLLRVYIDFSCVKQYKLHKTYVVLFDVVPNLSFYSSCHSTCRCLCNFLQNAFIFGTIFLLYLSHLSSSSTFHNLHENWKKLLQVYLCVRVVCDKCYNEAASQVLADRLYFRQETDLERVYFQPVSIVKSEVIWTPWQLLLTAHHNRPCLIHTTNVVKTYPGGWKMWELVRRIAGSFASPSPNLDLKIRSVFIVDALLCCKVIFASENLYQVIYIIQRNPVATCLHPISSLQQVAPAT